MANQRFIDIGVEGNDGTGDSIRESFRKTNENFEELYAAFGIDGTISFTSLGDTPDSLIPNRVPFVVDQSPGAEVDPAIVMGEFASNSALPTSSDNFRSEDSVNFEYTSDGKIILYTTFERVADDTTPTLGGPLDGTLQGPGGSTPVSIALGENSISESAVQAFNSQHNKTGSDAISIDNLVINKGYADSKYFNSDFPIRLQDEPTSSNTYVYTINGYTGNANVRIIGHPFKRAVNGLAVVYNSIQSDATNLTSGETYYVRFVNSDEISLHSSKQDAIDNINKITVSGTIAAEDEHTLTDADFDSSIEGNFLSTQAIPRKSAVRRQGDSMEGTLFLSDHPGDLAGQGTPNGQSDLQAATKYYVDTTTTSSPTNLYVSTGGDDTMEGVPKGREGTAFGYAFRTINAACRKAEELIQTSEPEPGPYIQTITVGEGTEPVTVQSADINNPVNEETRTLLLENRKYLTNEVVAYLEKTYLDLGVDTDKYKQDIGFIIDALAFDVNKSNNADSLSRKAGEKYYSDTAGRISITQQFEQTKDALDQLQIFVLNILNKRLNQEKNVNTVDKNTSIVTTTTDHSLSNGDQVIFRDMGGVQNTGMTEIENQTAYVRVIDTDSIELYEDRQLTQLFDISSYTDYTSGGRLGLIFQEREDYLDSVKQIPDFRENDSNPSSSAISNVTGNIDLIITIIEDGIEAGSVSTEGSFYNLTLDLKNESQIDQRTDTIPGKIIVGKKSGAKGRIIQLNGNNLFEVNLLTAKDFEQGEEVEYGSFVKTKQITVLVESGIYEEDYPIKVPQNVSIKGDEFRRTIVRPKNRVSQSPWSNIYFYRDLEFDGIQLLEKLHSDISSVGVSAPNAIEVDDTTWMSVGTAVKFKGNNLIGSEVDRNTTYYITGIVDAADGFADTSGIITVSDSPSGNDISWTSATGLMYVTRADVPPFVNQVGEVQGYFGRHYLTNPYSDTNIRPAVLSNSGGFTRASKILQVNRDFIIQEVTEQASGTVSTAQLDLLSQFAYIVIDSIIKDFVRGDDEFVLEAQGLFNDYIIPAEQTSALSAFEIIETISNSLLGGIDPGSNGSIVADVTEGAAESGTVSLLSQFIDILLYAFNQNYNPPKVNDADQMDVFLMNDATILRNITVQGHAGFMVVLDPEEQILTKSPYIQVGSAFSKSKNEKAFRGGMFVDAFVGNIPVQIDNVVSAFELEVSSDTGQGLFVRPPQLPCPFYLDGIRYQVNAIKEYDPSNGTGTLVLDPSSNNGNGYTGATGTDIFLQTAGNRSMLGNDFTQINDLGYGLVTNNSGISEMVSMFTYYCQAAYYAKNGSEIRSVGGSNGYGFFGLVAEGADPNEIPDEVTLSYPMVQPCLSYGVGALSNLEGDATITVYGCANPPLPESIVQVDHGSSLGVLNYRISTVSNLSDSDSDGTIGEDAGDVVATDFGSSQLNTVYELAIKGENASNDFFGTLQADIAQDDSLNLRNTSVQVLKDVADTTRVVQEKSTSINYDESDSTTYLTTSYADASSSTVPLESDEVVATTERDFELVSVTVSIANLSSTDPENGTKTVGASQGDTKIAVNSIDPDTVSRLLRDITGKQPGDSGYAGGMIFSLFGKTHSIVNYDDSGSFAYIEIEDVAGSEINSPTTTGLAQGIPTNRERQLFAGLSEDSTAEITLAISLCRATGHDFTEIGTGGYNTSNYPNVIFGEPELQPGEDNFFTNAPDATSAQIYEKRKGRVFVVSTDENGFFRVGKFFSVNQATGSIQFSGEIGVTDFVSLRFQNGTDVDEFSVDDTFADESNNTVPTERAIKGYIDRVLGYRIIDEPGNEGDPLLPADGRKGPGFLALDGQNEMEADIDMGGAGQLHKVVNLDLPGTDGTAAANKNYVDSISQAYDEFNDLRNIELNSVKQNDIVVGTGKNRLFCEITGGTITPGDIIELDVSGGNKSGSVIDVEAYIDDIEGNLNIITYTPLVKVITAGTISVVEGETITQATTGATGIVLQDFSGVNEIYLSDFAPLSAWDDSNNYELTGSISGSLGANSQVVDVDGQDFVTGEDIRDTGQSATATIVDGPAPEFANAYESSSSVINVTVNRSQTETTYDLQIQDESIINADVAPNAAIAQSKLNMQSADTFDEDSGTGWTNPSKTQADLGLSKFSDENFETDNGFVRIKNNGLVFAELQDIDQYTLYGRQTAGTGDPEKVSYGDAVKYGEGVEDTDFNNSTWQSLETLRLELSGDVSVVDGETITQDTTGASGVVQGVVDRSNIIYLRTYGNISSWDISSGFDLIGSTTGSLGQSAVGSQEFAGSGNALLQIESGVYATLPASIGTTGNTIARRTADGKLDAEEIKVQGFDTLRVTDSNTINLVTPGGATVLSSIGTGSTANDQFVTTFPGSVDVGQTTISSESNLQTGSSFSSEGWLAADWTYTSFIQAARNRNTAETGISLGTGSSVAGAADNVIIGVTNGTERFYIEDATTTVKNNLTVEGNTQIDGNTDIDGNTTLGSDSSDTVTFNADISSNIIPDNNLTRNIGSSGSRWDVMYAQTFNGTATEAKYADLAENYVADDTYESGTVVVFGGEYEITVEGIKSNTRVAGVVSKNPAHLMNSEQKGDFVTAVALQGRLPCKVVGTVKKGDMLVSAGIPGYAVVNNSPAVGTVIGKALQDKQDDLKGIVEIVVGRT